MRKKILFFLFAARKKCNIFYPKNTVQTNKKKHSGNYQTSDFGLPQWSPNILIIIIQRKELLIFRAQRNDICHTCFFKCLLDYFFNSIKNLFAWLQGLDFISI